MNTQWLIDIGNDSSKWNDDSQFDYLPTLIAYEYKRLHDLAREGNVYGTMLQIKDVFEIIIKYPSIIGLCLLSCNAENWDNSTNTYYALLKEILEKRLSFGDWVLLSEKLSNVNDSLPSNLQQLLKITHKTIMTPIDTYSNVIKWRNSTIGHGALRMEDDDSLANEIERLISRLHEYFTSSIVQTYNFFTLFQGSRALVGIASELSLHTDGDLYLKLGNGIIIDNLRFICQNDDIYFFDSYYRDTGKTKYINYIRGKDFLQRDPYFIDIYNKILQKKPITSKIIISEEESTPEIESMMNHLFDADSFIPLTFVYHWIGRKIRTTNKGTFMIKMGQGMGKSTLSAYLDQRYHIKNYIGIENYVSRTYHFSRNEVFSSSDFIDIMNNIYLLQMNPEENIIGKRETFRKIGMRQGGKSFSSQFADLMNSYAEYYRKKGKKCIILVLDGLDEITDVGIFDYFPSESMLNDGVYIFYTTRPENELSGQQAKSISRIGIEADNIFCVSNDNQSYRRCVFEYVKKYIKDFNIANLITEAEQPTFLRARFYVAAYNKDIKISSATNIDLLASYLLTLKKYAYGEKNYARKIKKILVLLAIFHEGLSVKELSSLLDTSDHYGLLAALFDLNPLLYTERTLYGNVFKFANEQYVSYVKRAYTEDIQLMNDELLQEIIGLSESFKENDAQLIDLYLNSGAFSALREATLKEMFIYNHFLTLTHGKLLYSFRAEAFHHYLRVALIRCISISDGCGYDIESLCKIVKKIIVEISNTREENWCTRDMWMLVLISRNYVIKNMASETQNKKNKELLLKMIISLIKNGHMDMTMWNFQMIEFCSECSEELYNVNSFLPEFFRALEQTNQQYYLRYIVNSIDKIDALMDIDCLNMFGKYAKEYDLDCDTRVKIENVLLNCCYRYLYRPYRPFHYYPLLSKKKMNVMLSSLLRMDEIGFSPYWIQDLDVNVDYNVSMENCWQRCITVLRSYDEQKIKRFRVEMEKENLNYCDVHDIDNIYIDEAIKDVFHDEIDIQTELLEHKKILAKEAKVNYTEKCEALKSKIENLYTPKEYIDLRERFDSEHEFEQFCHSIKLDYNEFAEWLWNLFDDGFNFDFSVANFELTQWDYVFSEMINKKDSSSLIQWIKKVSDRWGARLSANLDWENSSVWCKASVFYVNMMARLVLDAFQNNELSILNRYVHRMNSFINKREEWINLSSIERKKITDSEIDDEFYIHEWGIICTYILAIQNGTVSNCKDILNRFLSFEEMQILSHGLSNEIRLINRLVECLCVAAFTFDKEASDYFSSQVLERINQLQSQSSSSLIVEQASSMRKTIHEFVKNNYNITVSLSDREIGGSAFSAVETIFLPKSNQFLQWSPSNNCNYYGPLVGYPCCRLGGVRYGILDV